MADLRNLWYGFVKFGGKGQSTSLIGTSNCVTREGLAKPGSLVIHSWPLHYIKLLLFHLLSMVLLSEVNPREI